MTYMIRCKQIAYLGQIALVAAAAGWLIAPTVAQGQEL